MQEPEAYVFAFQSNVDREKICGLKDQINSNGIRSKFISSIDLIERTSEGDLDRCDSPDGWKSTKISPILCPNICDSDDFSTPSSSNLLEDEESSPRDEFSTKISFDKNQNSTENDLEIIETDAEISIKSNFSQTNSFSTLTNGQSPSKFEFSSNLFETLAPKYNFLENEYDLNDLNLNLELKSTSSASSICNGSRSEVSETNRNSSISRSARRRTSLTCRSYKDLLQRGLQVDGTAYVSSVAEKFLYQASSLTPANHLPRKNHFSPKIRVKLRQIGEDCESVASTSKEHRLTPMEVDTDDQDNCDPRVSEERREDELKFYSLEQKDSVLKANRTRVRSFDSKTCMLCEEESEDELISYQYCPSLNLCPICADPYEKWLLEPWKYANFRCKTKQRGLICRAYRKNDCLACWFWKCVEFVRQENIQIWPQCANPVSLSLDLEADGLSIGTSDVVFSDDCPSTAESGLRSPRFKAPKALAARPQDLCGHDEGPRIRYVCRRPSMVTGQMSPRSSKEPKNKIWLSALPRKLKKELVHERYKAIKFSRNKLILKLERQYSTTNDSSTIAEETGNILTKAKMTKKLRRCGSCDGCTAENCGVCHNCRDMPRFGGLGVLKAACRERQCEVITAHRDKKHKERKISAIGRSDNRDNEEIVL